MEYVATDIKYLEKFLAHFRSYMNSETIKEFERIVKEFKDRN